MSLAEKAFETPRDGQYFFGYYDKTPFGADDHLLLAQRSSFMNRLPTQADALELGYFSWRENNEFIPFAVSYAWNWQTGCMLQWVGDPSFRQVIYNTWTKEKGAHTVKQDLDTGETWEYDTAITAVSPNGRHALCVDFSHLQRVREGYGYPDVHMGPSSVSTSVKMLDLATNLLTDILELDLLLETQPIDTMEGTTHLVEHPIFSPKGDKFVFFHRWRLDDGAFYTRLYLFEIPHRRLTLLHDSGRVSHVAWRNNEEIVAFAGQENRINRLRKNKHLTKFILRPLLPVYHLITRNTPISGQQIIGDTYVLFSKKINDYVVLDAPGLQQDGHPSFHPKHPDWMLTDTYPDKLQRARLLLYSISRNTVKVLDNVSSVKDYDDTELRCDLHPRWSRTGSHICIDHMSGGWRGMRVYNVDVSSYRLASSWEGTSGADLRKVLS